MAKLVGNWKLMSTENFDEYMKAIGVNFALRKMANMTKPSLHITMDGDTWTMKTHSTVKNTEISFKIGEKFEEKTADGRTVQTTCTVEGDEKLVQSQKGDPDTVLTRTVEGDKLTLVCEAKGVVSTRIYERTE